jgi:hypothetical protein
LGDVNFDFIGQFESLDKDLEFIKNKLDINFDCLKMNSTSYTKRKNDSQNYSEYYPFELRQLNEYPNPQQFYTSELVEIVRRRYKHDIEMFSYNFEDV